MTTLELVDSLRQLADWYEKHPSLPVPHELDNPMFVFMFGLNEAEVKRILREIGSFKKVFDDPGEGDFHALKTVGRFQLKFHVGRDVVCSPRVTGKRLVEKQVIEAVP